MRNIYVVGGDAGYANWCEANIVHRMEDANLVMFTGGADVTPSLYGKLAHPTTGNYIARDAREVREFLRAKELGLPMIGICRGAQFLCVMAGGILVQDQHHPYIHNVFTSGGEVITVTSTHHQRQYIKGIEDKVDLLAWAEHLSPYNFGESDDDVLSGEEEVEIAYYKNIHALAIQSHPEFCYPYQEDWHEPYITYCRDLIEIYLGV